MEHYKNVMSANYERCRELLRTLDIPTRSEAIDLLGDPLAGVVFQQCQPRELREAFGLEPPLEGPGPELWISPSDLLIGKVVLKPPLTQKHIQALTHQGILKIGAVVEEKFFNKMEKDKQDCLEKQDEFLRKMFELKLKQEIERTRQREHEKCDEQLHHLTLYFDDYIHDVVDHVEQHLQKLIDEYEEANANQKENFENELRGEVERITRGLTDDFLNKLQEQETTLVNIFTKKLDENEMKHKCAMDFERVKCKENLIQLKHSLECKNISNLMYVLCRERRKCKVEKTAIENEYEMKITQLTEGMVDRDVLIQELEEVRARKKRQVETRERCLVEILKQYQKFINYALRAAPTQAEFLLNIDRMMTFEIDDYCVEHGDKGDSAAEEETDESTGDEREQQEVEVKVENLESKLPPKEQREPSDVLPAIYLNDKLYVREDFRDRFTNNMTINPSHELWNQDVEELMNVFREQVGKDRNGEFHGRSHSMSFFSSVHFNKHAPAPLQSEASVIIEEVPNPAVEEEIIEEEIVSVDGEASQKLSAVHVGILKNEKNSPIDGIGRESSKTSQKPSPSRSLESDVKPPSNPSLKKSIGSNTSTDLEFKNKARSLLAVTDSLEVIREKRSSLGGQDDIQDCCKTFLPRKMSGSSSSVLNIKHTPGVGRRISITIPPVPVIDDVTTMMADKISNLARDSLDFQHESVRRQSMPSAAGIEKFSQGIKEEDSLPVLPEDPESKLLEVNDSLEKIRTTIHNSNIALHLNAEMQDPPSAHRKPQPGTGRKSVVGFIPKVVELKSDSRDKLGGKSSETMAIPRQGAEFEARKCQKCKVVGDPDAWEGIQDAQEFTKHRVREFVDLIKDSPSLIGLFTT